MKSINEKEFKALTEYIDTKRESANTYFDVDVEDVLFSYFYSTEDTFWLLNDWNEGIEEENDQINHIKDALKLIKKLKDEN